MTESSLSLSKRYFIPLDSKLPAKNVIESYRLSSMIEISNFYEFHATNLLSSYHKRLLISEK